ncbi:arsenite methyltransferase [Syntrophomonas palmitatica]|uniref:arsenite methyltransferase n=1 Tax=Syntrophomonas palmitatica TaxID=402877 RepID=UPI0006D00ED8|nr:arsenite methyltransferase [Syntrophomonas palmitatica]
MSNDMREEVKKHYGNLAADINAGKSAGCCGAGGSCRANVIGEAVYDLNTLKDVPKEAISASLGCANPLVLANLQEGEIVLDLGSGAGLDALASSRYVGDTGKVFGLDMTGEMLKLARANRDRMGAQNVEFLQGYVEEIPLPDSSVDVVMSNCVINLSVDKKKVFREIYRVLKPGGRLAMADIVALHEVAPELREMIGPWVGCIGGALVQDTFRDMLTGIGFIEVQVEPEHFYSAETLASIIGSEDISSMIIKELDGVFAGAFIKGKK